MFFLKPLCFCPSLTSIYSITSAAVTLPKQLDSAQVSFIMQYLAIRSVGRDPSTFKSASLICTYLPQYYLVDQSCQYLSHGPKRPSQVPDTTPAEERPSIPLRTQLPLCTPLVPLQFQLHYIHLLSWESCHKTYPSISPTGRWNHLD